MSSDLINTAPTVVTAFGQTGGILGLIVLALLLIVGAISWMNWKFMSDMVKNHEKRMDAQEIRHQSDRASTNQHWQQVTREITADMKTVLAEIGTRQNNNSATIESINRGVDTLKRRRSAA